MRWRARRLWLWLAGTVAVAVAVVPISVLLGVPGLIFVVELLALLALPLEAAALVALRRTERILRTYGWETFPASFEMLPGDRVGQKVKIEFARGQTAPFSGGVLTRSPEGRSRRAHPELVWFAGDRRLGGATSPVGGGCPVLIYRQRRAKGKAALGTAEANALAQKAGLDRAPKSN
ncbi:hypothetical protein GCM10010191_01760 [Actinomadura vinacea]|uniref:DUF58 domain-containing protein n=1 Tax=Actinomadura vinacea TaxID=115336 RepID=A0ABN3I9Q3_9ACTN